MKLSLLIICLFVLGCATNNNIKNEFNSLDSSFSESNRLPATTQNTDIFYDDAKVKLSKSKLEKALADAFNTSIKGLVIYTRLSEKMKVLDVFGLGDGSVWYNIQFTAANRYQARCQLTYFKYTSDIYVSSCVSSPEAIFVNKVFDSQKIYNDNRPVFQNP